jgi:hypothetical protein
VDYRIIPKADDAIPAVFELAGAGCVFFVELRMLTAVELDREFSRGTGEIDNERPDRMLPAKPMLGRQLSQRSP